MANSTIQINPMLAWKTYYPSQVSVVRGSGTIDINDVHLIYTYIGDSILILYTICVRAQNFVRTGSNPGFGFILPFSLSSLVNMNASGSVLNNGTALPEKPIVFVGGNYFYIYSSESVTNVSNGAYTLTTSGSLLI